MLPRPTAEPVAASTKPIRDDHWLWVFLAMSALLPAWGAGAAVGPHGRPTTEGSGEGHVCLLEF